MTDEATPELVVRANAQVGEGPLWDSRTDELVWVDILDGVLHLSRPVEGTDRQVSLGTMLGAVGLRAGGGFVAAVAAGLGFMDALGTLTLVEGILSDPALRMNDAKCDSAGRFWAGSTTMTFVPGRGALRCWTPGQGGNVVMDGLTLPNGLGWSPDDRTFYLVESMARQLYAFDVDRDDDALGRRRTLLEFSASDCLPDGLCVDADGCLWIAMWGSGQVRRYSRDGVRDRTVHLPVSQPSSCAFGPGGVLYVTSARAGLSDQQLGAEPLAGSVFAVQAGVEGVPVGVFGG